ncbi:hypothetical protein LINPERPRIM_LOCUS6939 [Linum perenne]
MLFLAVLSLLVFVWGSLDAKVKFLILSTEVLLLVMSRHPILANILDSLHHRHLVEDALVLAPEVPLLNIENLDAHTTEEQMTSGTSTEREAPLSPGSDRDYRNRLSGRLNMYFIINSCLVELGDLGTCNEMLIKEYDRMLESRNYLLRTLRDEKASKEKLKLELSSVQAELVEDALIESQRALAIYQEEAIKVKSAITELSTMQDLLEDLLTVQESNKKEAEEQKSLHRLNHGVPDYDSDIEGVSDGRLLMQFVEAEDKANITIEC